MSDTDITWAVSSLLVGGIPGCLVAGQTADTLGRRKSLSLCYVISTIGWILVSLARNVPTLIAGRVMHGLGEAMVVVISNMYLGEMVSQKNKGAILCSLSVACWAGTTMVYSLGVVVGWREGAGVGAGINMVGLLCLGFIPESPYWLARRSERFIPEEALGIAEEQRDMQAQEEMESDEKGEREDKKQSLEVEKSLQHCSKTLLEKNSDKSSKTYSVPSSFCSITVLIPPILLIITPLNGGFSMAFFAIDLVGSMGFSHPELLSIFIALLRTIGVVFSMIFVQMYGRRHSLLISSSVVAICCFLISVLLYTTILPNPLSDWTLIIFLLISMFTSGLGISSIPWVLASEWPEMNMKVQYNKV